LPTTTADYQEFAPSAKVDLAERVGENNRRLDHNYSDLYDQTGKIERSPIRNSVISS
jgi:hypothetical protein